MFRDYLVAGALPAAAVAILVTGVLVGGHEAHAGDTDISCANLDPLQGGSPINIQFIGVGLEAGDVLVVNGGDVPFRIEHTDFENGGVGTFTAEVDQRVTVSVLRRKRLNIQNLQVLPEGEGLQIEDAVAIPVFMDKGLIAEIETVEVSCGVGGVLGGADGDDDEGQPDVAVSSLALNRARTTLTNLPGLAEQVFLNPGSQPVTGSIQGDNVFVSAHIKKDDGIYEDLGIWLRGKYTDYEFDQGGTTIDGDSVVIQGGIDYRFTDRIAAGIMVQGDFISESAPGVDTSDGQGFLVGPYLTVNVTEDVYVEALAMAGRSNNTLTNAAGLDSDYTSDRYLVSGRVFGHFHLDQLQIEPSARFTYYTEESDSFTDGSGTFVPSSTDSVGQFRFGPKLGYQIGDEEFGVLPFIQAEAVYNFSEIGAASVNQDINGFNAALTGGLEMVINPATFIAEVRYEGLGDSDFDAISASFLVSFPFGG